MVRSLEVMSRSVLPLANEVGITCQTGINDFRVIALAPRRRKTGKVGGNISEVRLHCVNVSALLHVTNGFLALKLGVFLPGLRNERKD